MSVQTAQSLELSDLLKVLEEQISTSNTEVKTFEEAFKKLSDYRWKLQQLLEYVVEQNSDNKTLKDLYARVAGENATELIDKLRGLGYEYSRDNAIRDAFEKQGYRLLEQARNGNRDMVFYGILRIFVSLKRKVHKSIVEAFKPIYSQELFKVFIFSFLSGLLGKEE